MTQALHGGSRSDWIARLSAATVSCGPLNEIADLAGDPQVVARDGIVDLTHPRLGAVRSAASPLRLSEAPPTYRRPPPALGEHADEVLVDWLGLDAGGIGALRATGAIA